MTSLGDPSNAPGLTEAQDDLVRLLHQITRVDAQDGYQSGPEWVVKVLVADELSVARSYAGTGRARRTLVHIWPSGQITWEAAR